MKQGGFFFFQWVATLMQKTVSKTTREIVLAGYYHNTIYRYFRKQGAKIGEGCVFSIKSLGTEPYLITIGNHVWITNNVVFHTHDGGVWVVRDQKNPQMAVFGPIIIEDNCVIGAGTHLLPNIRIGKNSIVAAGSVVISDVPPDTIVMGVPARPVGSVSKYKEKCLARWEIQKPPDLDTTKPDWSQSRKANNKMQHHLTELFFNQSKEK